MMPLGVTVETALGGFNSCVVVGRQSPSWTV